MEHQKTSLQGLICSLNASELQSLIFQLSENDALLFDRIIGIIRHLFPNIRMPNTPQWDPKEILAQAHRILHPRSMCQYEMEAAGDSYDDLLLSLQEIFRFCSKVEMIQILQGLTELVAKDLDRIMGNCDEGLPWQSVAKHLGKYWIQLISCKDLVDADHSSLFSFLSKWIPQFANYGLDQPFYPAIKILQKRCTT